MSAQIITLNPADARWESVYILAMLLLLFAPLPLSAETDKPSSLGQNLEKVRLQLKWKHQFQFAGYYAALEKGFYRDAGLAVEIKQHGGDRAPAEVLIDGNAEYAVTGADVVIHRAKGRPLVALAAIYQHSPYAFLVRADSGIERVEDLAGKRIMLGTGSQDAALHATLRRAGLKMNYYRLSSSFDALSLLRGETDAFNAYITDQGFLLEQAGAAARYLIPKKYGVDFYGDILVTTEHEIARHSDRVRRFREASLKGWEYALAHPEELIDLILKRYNTQNMSREHLQYEARASRELIQPLLVQTGHMNPQRWEHIRSIFVELGFIDDDAAIEGLIYRESPLGPRWLSWVAENWIVLIVWGVVILALLLFAMVVQMKRLVRRRTAELAGSEQRYRTIFNAAPEGMWLIDPAKRTLDVNERLQKLLGLSRQEMVGHTPLEFVDEENRKIFIEQMEKIATSERRSYDIELRHKDGRNVPTHISAVTLRDEVGEVMAALAFVEDISERKEMEAELRRSESNLRTLIDAEPACVKTLDREGRLITMNAAGLALIQAESIDQVRNAVVADLVDERDRDAFIAMNDRVFQGNEETLTFAFNGLKGKKVWLETHAVPIFGAEGEVVRALGVTHDVTERLMMEQQVKDKSEFLQRVIDSIGDAVMVVDTDYRIQLMNQAVRDKLTAFKLDPENIASYYDLPYYAEGCRRSDGGDFPVKSVLEGGGRASTIIDCPVSTHGAETKRMEIVASPLLNPDGSLRGVIEVARDITEHLELLDEVQRQKDDLQHLVHHDALTNLPNRILFMDRLEQAIHKAHRAGTMVAVLFVDLDRFKEINDSLGHVYGDKVLEEVSRRFDDSVREDDTVARLGGDEFTFISESVTKTQHAAVLAQKLISSLEQPFLVGSHQFYLTASVGISLYPQDGQTAETLLRNADAAMYRAKDEGKNTFQYYTQDMTEQAFERMFLEANLRRALLNEELTVFYQAQVNAVTGRVIGVEALVRWQHPDLGLVSPAKFIPLAEDTGLIVPLGDLVMQMACRQMKMWDEQGVNPGKLSINLSMKQMAGDRLLSSLREVMEETGCRPEWLELEVTEGSLMRDPDKSIALMQEIRALGIELAIDDFGIGYSSLAYLKRFPITRLKIDQSFIRDIPKDVDDMEITRAVIALGQSLRLNVIAEGVEKEEQKDFLILEGCSEVQGYLYSRPIPAEEMTRWLEGRL